MRVLFRSVLRCGLLRTVFMCWDFVLFGGMACVGVEGQWYEFLERQFCLVEGYGVGDLWLVGFSRASKILLAYMFCSSFRWLFLVNSVYM